MNKYFAVVLLAVCLMVPCIAQADGFTFQYTGGSSSASGELSATANGDGSFTAVSGSGLYSGFTFVDVPITLYANPIAPAEAISPSGAIGYDNQLFPSGGAAGLISYWGLLFTMADTSEVNIYQGGSTFDSYAGYLPSVGSDTGTFTLTAVPEPGSILLMGTLLLGVAGALKRKLG
jgi:hypothetical protein